MPIYLVFNFILYYFLRELDRHKIPRAHHLRTKMFVENPDWFPAHHRQTMLDGIIAIGMAPIEANLADSSFSRGVIIDLNIGAQQPTR